MTKRTDFNDLGRVDFSLISEISKHTLPEPLPLVPEREPPTPYPLEALGHVLVKAARAITEHVHVAEAMAGQAVIAAAALAAQAHVNVKIDGRTRPVSLFNMTVARSGDRKSSADNWALRAHSEFQRKLYHEYREDMKRRECELEAYLSRHKKDRSCMEKPQAPRQPFMMINELTLEGVHKAFRDGRPSQGLFDDEGGQFIGGHAMNKDNLLKTVAGLSKLWDGTGVSRVRSGQGENFMLHGCRFSCHLMLQPLVADIVLSNKLLQSQGLLARFLISQPQSLAGTRLYQESDPTQDKRLDLYWRRMTELLEMPLRLNKQGELEPRDLTPSTQAKRLWIAAYNAIEQQLGPQGKFVDIQATAAKAAENILRMAGVIEFVDNPECALIEEDSLRDATRLMEYYLAEAVRLAYIVPVSEHLVQAQKVLEWLQAHGWTQFTLRQFYKTGPRFARSASQARALLNVLKRHYWVVAERDGWRMR